MAITDAARRNHEQLFPGRVSTLAVSDPEFVEYFDNFAFDEVIAHDDLPVELRLKCILAALIAMHTIDEYRVMVGGALEVGVTPVEIKEIVYHAVPYCGIGKVFDALNATNEVFAARGVPLPLPGQSTNTPETRREAGIAAQKAIFGAGSVDARMTAAPPELAHLQEYLAGNCFGDIYTRGGLPLVERELLTFVMLVAMGGAEPQATSHASGNARVGNGRQRLIDVVTQLLPYIGYPRTLNAIACINQGVPA